jgi:hypothetical protein
LYVNFGHFQTCVIAVTITYAMILPILPLVPQKLISTAGEIDNPKPNFALFLAQTMDIVCSGGVGLSTRWA